ncbi:hypothetical protein [Candidatus Lokiarchaeum ossiferum]|uniref:hypothetical protein n=1 Tax=Candidatus Lokiarchaeum ossiferum TaxID=2951803 RepID=UPI00352E9B7B
MINQKQLLTIIVILVVGQLGHRNILFGTALQSIEEQTEDIEIVYEFFYEDKDPMEFYLNLSIQLFHLKFESIDSYQISCNVEASDFEAGTDIEKLIAIGFTWHYDIKMVSYFMEQNVSSGPDKNVNITLIYNFTTPKEIASFQWKVLSDTGRGRSGIYCANVDDDLQDPTIWVEKFNEFTYDVEVRSNKSAYLINNQVIWPNTSMNVLFGEWNASYISVSNVKDSFLDEKELIFSHRTLFLDKESGRVASGIGNEVNLPANSSTRGGWAIGIYPSDGQISYINRNFEYGNLGYDFEFSLRGSVDYGKMSFRYNFQECSSKKAILTIRWVMAVIFVTLGIIGVLLWKQNKPDIHENE